LHEPFVEKKSKKTFEAVRPEKNVTNFIKTIGWTTDHWAYVFLLPLPC
jgi:hypothetical protein